MMDDEDEEEDDESQVGDCPRCGKRTFVIQREKSAFTRGHLKGKCYSCGHSQKID
jgi:hypothetical protein